MNIAVILAGGSGTRAGTKIPKQYLKIKDRPIFVYCLETFAAHPMIDGIQIVADADWHDFIRSWIESEKISDKWRGFSNPGKNRQLSIYNALEDIMLFAAADDLIVIHDAVRPMMSTELLTRCLENAEGHDGVLPVLPMKDTIYMSRNGWSVSSLLDRDSVFAGQAPEVFRVEKYYLANRALIPDAILQIKGSTEPAIIAGMDIVMVAGEEANYKITTKQDLDRFEADLTGRSKQLRRLMQ